MLKYFDVIVDVQAGDTGKGKVCHHLSQEGDYTHVIRYNGGGNAGHTIYKNGKKIVTHFIPTGIVNGIKSIIGPGCVVNIESLMREIEELEKVGIEVKGKLFIDNRVHIITDEHIQEDSKDINIGTTKTGNGPAYRDKYIRKGIRAIDKKQIIGEFLIDIYSEIYGKDDVRILFEGAQGFELDIDWGDYPYVTSSHCTVGSAILNGVAPQKLRKVYGIAKVYNTYVGAKHFESDNPIFDKIREIGSEYGSTTGRPRQVNWTNIDEIVKACNINGVTNLIFNKMDVLEQIGNYVITISDLPRVFTDKQFFIEFITEEIKKNCPLIEEVTFSSSAEKV